MTFDEAVELASERANAEGGRVVVHRSYCGEPLDDNCPCQPVIVSPYSKIAEIEAEGLLN